MLNEFNELPLEMRSNILRYNPLMRRINKTYYESTKHYFYDHYCDQPINKKEFINYVENNHPEQFAMIIEKEEAFIILLFESMDDDKYDVQSFHLRIELADVEEYNIIYDYANYRVQPFKDFMFMYNHYFKHHVYYDVLLTMNIVYERGCQNINDLYALQYTKNDLIKNLDNTNTNELNRFFKLISNIYYLYVSYAIYKNAIDGVQDYFFDNNISDVLFDSMGNAIDDMSDRLEYLDDEYNKYYDLVLRQLQ